MSLEDLESEFLYLAVEGISYPGADLVPVPVIFAITAPRPGLLAVIGAFTAGFLASTSTAIGVIFLIVSLCAAAFKDFDFSAGPAFFKKAFLLSGFLTTGAFLSTDFVADVFTEVFFGEAAFFTAAFFTGVSFLVVDFFCAIEPPVRFL
jgi:hypothetical protein